MKPSIALLAAAIVAVGTTGAVSAELERAQPEDVEWMATPFGVEAYPVSGDFTTGKHATMIKFAAGTRTPTHVHSHDYVGVVVKGQGIQFEASSAEEGRPLEPGSVWSIPANLPHVSGCTPKEDCIFVLYQDHPFDYSEVE